MYVIMGRMYVRGDSLIIKLLFLKDSSTLCYSSSLSIFLYCFSDPPLIEGLSHYIEFSKSSPSYSCSSSNFVLKYVSYQASSLALCEQQWLRILFRGLLHINAARKVAAVHLMWWWQLFSKIFLYPSSPYVLEVYPHCWSLLEDYPSYLDACSTDIRSVRGGCPPWTSALHYFQMRLSILGPPQSFAPPWTHPHQ